MATSLIQSVSQFLLLLLSYFFLGDRVGGEIAPPSTLFTHSYISPFETPLEKKKKKKIITAVALVPLLSHSLCFGPINILEMEMHHSFSLHLHPNKNLEMETCTVPSLMLGQGFSCSLVNMWCLPCSGCFWLILSKCSLKKGIQLECCVEWRHLECFIACTERRDILHMHSHGLHETYVWEETI